MKRFNRRHILQAGGAAALWSLTGDVLALGEEARIFANGSGWGGQSAGGCLLCQATCGPSISQGQYPRPATFRPRPSLLGGEVLARTTNGRPHPSAAAPAEGKPIIVQPSWIIVPDGDGLKLLHDQEVVVKGDRIEELRPRKYRAVNSVVADGQILLPGFISGHTHSAAGTMTRGLIEENSFAAVQSDDPRLPSRSLLRPMVLMEELSDEELDDLTALNLAEIVRSGCTTQVEMSLSLKQMQSYVRVARRFGIRGYPSGMVPGMKRLLAIWGRSDDRVLHASVPETLAEIKANLTFAKAINGRGSERIRPMMGPSVTSVHTEETFAAIRRAASELGNGVHIHVQNGWDPNDRKALERLWGKQEVAILRNVGLLDAPLFGAHLLGIDPERDLPILAQHDFTFAHCPSAAGASVLPSSQPWPEAVAAGVNTSIGLDTHSNDYVENIKLAVMQGRARSHLLGNSSPVALKEPTIWTALISATLGGARGLGRNDLGRIEAGAKADLCTIDVSSLLVGNGTAPREPCNNLLYANGLSVRNVMTDGTWQVLDGKLMFDDEARIVARGGSVVRKVWAQLEAENFFVPMPR